MNRFDIHDGVHPFGNCRDRRPWLIVDVLGDGKCNCFPISGENYSDKGFPIPREHPDFAATGLKKSCFIHDETKFCLSSDEIKARRGVLSGSLLHAFCEYAGLSPT